MSADTLNTLADPNEEIEALKVSLREKSEEIKWLEDDVHETEKVLIVYQVLFWTMAGIIILGTIISHISFH